MLKFITITTLTFLMTQAAWAGKDSFQVHTTKIKSLMCTDFNACQIIPAKKFDRKLMKGKACGSTNINIDMKKASGTNLLKIAMKAYELQRNVQIHVYNYKCDGTFLKLHRIRFL